MTMEQSEKSQLGEKEFIIVLPLSALNIVSTALGQLPYVQVRETISLIQKQVDRQLLNKNES